VKAVVIHHNLNAPGGEATVAIETIQSLYNLGYDVELITVQKPNLEGLSKAYGKGIPVKSVKSLFPFKINYFGIYQKLLSTISSLSLGDSDIVVSTNGNTLPYKVPTNILCVLYVHFPTSLLISAGYENNKYRKSLFRKAYFRPYQLMANALMKRALSRSNVIFTNSRFTKDAVSKVYPNFETNVLYPPVDIERFSSAYRSNSRERRVLVISRFSPEKEIEKSIRVARLLKGSVMFEVIGSLIPANHAYFKSIQKLIRDYGLENKVILTPNASNEDLLKSMSTSKVYLHTMYGEHFGVSVVEAMAAGLVPIVPYYGGCSEVVPPNCCYNGLEDAANCISENLDVYDNRKKIYVYNIAKQFSSSRFRIKMQEYIEQAYMASTNIGTNIVMKAST
jgi:alpha-1,2-mannosyltransferase